jgi:hypothetical protein
MARFLAASQKKTEDAMRRAVVFLLFPVLVLAGYRVRAAAAQETQQKATQGRWHGVIARWDKENSVLDVQKGNAVRKVYYDSSTQWTEGTKTIDMSQFKEGSEVNCIGTYDKNTGLHATRIDLKPR